MFKHMHKTSINKKVNYLKILILIIKLYQVIIKIKSINNLQFLKDPKFLISISQRNKIVNFKIIRNSKLTNMEIRILHNLHPSSNPEYNTHQEYLILTTKLIEMNPIKTGINNQ